MARRANLRDRITIGILDTAATVLAERGDSASMADIAEAAGVSRATLYRYFPSRDALVRGLEDTAVAALNDKLADAELDTVPVREAVARLTRGFVAVGNRYVALERLGPKPAHLGAAQEQLGQALHTLFKRGIADGTLRSDLTPEILVQVYAGLIEAAIGMSAHGTGPEQASAAVLTIFLNGAEATA